jgi:predicted phage gp36 major capsid-like protein
MGVDRKLWDEYRSTWEAFSRDLDKLQASAEGGNRQLVEEALLEVDRAKSAHNAARDRLAAHLSGRIAAQDAADARSEEDLIREKARLLWELSGRPQGTAEADWLDAERLVRSASVG